MQSVGQEFLPSLALKGDFNMDINENLSAPTLEQMESAKSALMTFVMYHYQSLRESGYTVNDAKQIIADNILELYNNYASVSELPKIQKHTSLIDPQTLIAELIKDSKALGISGKPIYNKLLDLKKLLTSN